MGVRRRLLDAVALLCCLAALPVDAGSITYSECTAAGVPLKVVSIDLTDLNVRVTGQIAKYGAGHAEPFCQMVRRSRPAVAVTGTFFGTRTRIPIGDIVIGGNLAHFGGRGTALCISDNNEVRFVRPRRDTRQDWSEYDFVLGGGPRLVRAGRVHVDPRAEGFRDRSLFRPAARVAVGVTNGNRLIIAATRKPVSLRSMAKALRALNVVDAISLDGGASLGLYFRGRKLIQPHRWMTNLLLVYDDRWAYDQVRDRLAPDRRFTRR